MSLIDTFLMLPVVAMLLPMVTIGFISFGARKQAFGLDYGLLLLCRSGASGDRSFIDRRIILPWERNTLPCSLIGKNL
jgi:hypothetical protein